ncbi:alpha/beta hydrolase [Geodermatophilus sp. DSM 44513]|uniref:alpha/beta hydrolase n=1 Tax=Geodermatophilus sp. DSM 44513 TaxID=1528104 RepID=UPI00126B9DCF|nr:alpha/beta hydrolase [Geodermatophilus sp. DSM 44513]WNV74134.1 alpha/beta hydrolase [Geodermatophilus sp. DSM 44513]
MREDIEFTTEDGVTLRGWHYAPDDGAPDTRRPLVVMAHGFSAVKEMHLDDFAEHFAAGGLGVLVYDHRNLGASDGEPRGEIDPWQQVRDYRTAITWAQGQPWCDPDRIGIWGSSYSGGHVLVVGALDRRVRCVVAQVPLVSGLANARRLIRSDVFAGLRQAFDADRAARYAGGDPATIQVAWEDEPTEDCALPTQDTHDFFLGPMLERAPTWRNEVTLRSVEMFVEYEPGAYIADLAPTPLMVVVAARDHLTVADLTLEYYERAREPKELLVLPVGHFDAYVGEAFARSAPAQLDWFRRHLT